MRLIAAALLLLLASARMACAEEPAVAESPWRLFTVDAIELNHWIEANPEPGDDLPSTRFVFWCWRWLPKQKRWQYTCCGTADFWHARVSAIPGLVAVEVDGVRVEAPIFFVTSSTLDSAATADHVETWW